MEKMNEIQKRLIAEVAELHDVPMGAYNFRANGKLAGEIPPPTLIFKQKKKAAE